MAFTENNIPVGAQDYFKFYATGDGASANMDESLDPGYAYKILNVKVSFSGVCSADIYFRATLDAIEGAAYDGILNSYALSNSTDYYWEPSQALILEYGDIIQMSCVTDNTWSIIATGVKITQ